MIKRLLLAFAFAFAPLSANAADTKISALSSASALGGTEALPCVQSAATVACTVSQIATYVRGNLGVVAGTSLALGGCTIGTDNLCVTGAVTVSTNLTAGGAAFNVSSGTGKTTLYNGGVLAWASGASAPGTADLGLSRVSAGVLGVGVGTAGSITGAIKAAAGIFTSSIQLTSLNDASNSVTYITLGNGVTHNVLLLTGQTDGILQAGASTNAGPGLKRFGNAFAHRRADDTIATFSTLTACASGGEGALTPVSDSSTATWGATITGGGSNHVMAYCNGTNWTVAAI